MDETYQKSLVKSFKKTVDDGLFNFLIVDMINERVSQIDEMSSHAKSKGYFFCVAELMEPSLFSIYFNRNVHNRSIDEIKNVGALISLKTSSYLIFF